MEKDYEPFGQEWKKEVMKMRKQDIVNMLKDALQKVTSNDEAWVDGYQKAQAEACEEIAKNYHPNR
jgi:hypothetical protein